jgi:cytochrome bd-type quinol oxidase subunit 2
MHTPTPYRGSLGRFAFHYVEMCVAMLAGMVVLGMPALLALEAVGVTGAELRADAPAVSLLGMAVTMTVPMVAWMRFRGHGARANVEMSLAMLLPALGAVALLAAGLVEDHGSLMAIEHVAMFAAMLGAMLVRPAEYACARHARVAA